MSYNPSPTQSSRRRSIASIKSRRSSTTSIASTGMQVMGPESKRTSKIMYKILNDGDSYVPLYFGGKELMVVMRMFLGSGPMGRLKV
jgi:hypothetical protein